MSKAGELRFFDNKQMIHIASEIVVLIGISFYFSSKNKKLLGHIEELAQRIEEQEDTIQKLESALQQVNGRFAQMEMAIAHLQLADQNLHEKFDSGQQNSQPVGVQPIIKNIPKRPIKLTQETVPASVVKSQNKPRHFTPVVEEISESLPSQPKVQFKTQPDTEHEPESESDLDDEIRAELEELSENQTDFKKDTSKVK